MHSRLITLTEMPSEVNLTHLTKELKISVDELDNTVLNEVTLVVKRHPEGKWMDVDDPKLHPNGVNIVILTLISSNFCYC